MPPQSEPPVIIVGAGVAGLACALDLVAAGVPVTVLEGADAVGGRMRTDQRQGFLLDRGFQVFNTSYPQVKRRLDLRGLQLRPFTPGVLLQAGDRRVRFTDPTRQPAGAADLLRGRLGGPADVLALARLSAADMLLPAGLIKHQPDRTTFAALGESGVSPELFALRCTTTRPMSAMSASRTRATPSGSDSRAATSATDRGARHSSATARCSSLLPSTAMSGPCSLVDTSVSTARSNTGEVRPLVQV